MLLMTAAAVMFESTGDPSYNTAAPTGALTNSGWQYQGTWLAYLGTPIAPRYFITAKHVGGSTNDTFGWNGYTYHPVGFVDCPTTDLRIWRVAETFPRYAPLYTGTNEVGRPCVVIGRGTQRGAPVVVEGVTNGWHWGAGDGVQRWGENVVEETLTIAELPGEYLRMAFNRGSSSNECHLSVGDSSGALFIADGGTWKLAGIHSTVDGYFSVDGQNSNKFLAALLDMGGLFVGDTNVWTLTTNQVTDVPSSFYSVRVSSAVAWIHSVIDFLPGDDLRLTGIAVAGNDVRVRFQSFTNRLYRLERCDDLVAGNWVPWTNNIPGTNGFLTLTDTDAVVSPRRFYRLGLDL